MTSKFLITPLNFFLITLLFSCNNDKKSNQEEKGTVDTIKKSNVTDSGNQKKGYTRPPIINITDTVSVKRTVIVVKDSASTEEAIAAKLAKIYGEILPEIIKKNNLKITGAPMAWFQTQKTPFFFEAGLPIDKKPAKLTPQIKVKEIGIDSVVVVHFYGPYHLTSYAYEAVKDRMKTNNKKLAGAPYEIYVTDPIGKDGKPLDPYKVQTDIVFPRK